MGVAASMRSAWDAWWSPQVKDQDGQPLWTQLLVTFAFNSALALLITLFVYVFAGGRRDLGELLWANFVVAQSIGYCIHLLFMLAARVFGAERIDGWTGTKRAALFTLVPLAGMTIGYPLGFALLGQLSSITSGRVSGWFVLGAVLIWAVITVLWWRFQAHQLRLLQAERQLAEDRARAAALQQQALDAQLRALQAQIEPHFLFNTLANVVSLIDSRPRDARRMLERLIDLLRASLSASRAQRATLGQEFDLCRAYLEILAIRMAGRLQWEVELAAALRAQPVPPLLLQPLVENAIQHGLEPKIGGGRVKLCARRPDEGSIEIVVEDDGVGFGATTRGGGVGLATLRERLAALFHGNARLAIEDAQPGTRVRLMLPASGPSRAVGTSLNAC